MLNEELLFTDGTPFYCTYIENKGSFDVDLRVRTGADEAARVYVRTQGKNYQMEKEMNRDGFDYYKICLKNCENGAAYDFRHGFCLETQYYPDAVNQKNFKSPLVPANTLTESDTIFKFKV